jgi:hypothetical protein
LWFVCLLAIAPVARPADYIWPLSRTNIADELNTSFGPRLNRAMWDFHDGMDLPAPIGTPIYATRGGTVHRVGNGGQNGFSSRHVVLRVTDPSSDVLYIVHLHLDSIAAGITSNAVVSQGQLIGTVGIDGASHAHLHLEFRRGANQEIRSVHPLLYLPYVDTVNFTAPSNVVVNRLGERRAARLLFEAPSRLEGDLARVEVDLRAGTTVLATRGVNFNDKTTIYDGIGDAFVYTNDIGVEGYQAPDMKGEGRTNLKQGILVRNLPDICDNLVARVWDIRSNLVTSVPLPVPTWPRVEQQVNFEDGALPPPGWSTVVSGGLLLHNTNGPGAAYNGTRGLLASDPDPTTNSQQRAAMDFILPTGTSNRFEWVAEAWVRFTALDLPAGRFVYPLAFMEGNRTVVAARLRNEGGVWTVGMSARNPDFSCGNQDCFAGNIGTFTGPWLDVWRRWRLRISRLNTREATAVLHLDGQEVSRMTFDNTGHTIDRLRAGLALTDRGVTAIARLDDLRVSESTPAAFERVEITREGQHYVLVWEGGLSPFDVQGRSNLLAGDWQTLATVTNTNRVVLTNLNPAGFYRVTGP